MTKARDLADLGGVTTRLDEVGNTEGALSNRNMIINGAMQVSQRGTSAVTINTASEVFRSDRFRFEQGTATANNGTIEVASDAPTGFKYSTKVTAGSSVTFGSNGFGSLNYRIEGQDVDQLANGTASAQQATLSFWVKSSVTGTYSINITKYDGSTERFHVKTYTVNSANTWEYKAITFDGDTVGSALDWMRLYWQLGGDSGAYNATPNTWVNGSATVRGVSSQANMITTSGATFQITGIQLEVGDTATPFENRSYGDELARCQRYFEVQGQFMDEGGKGLDTYTRLQFQFKATKRTAPTITFSPNSATDGSASGVGGAWFWRNNNYVTVGEETTYDAEL